MNYFYAPQLPDLETRITVNHFSPLPKFSSGYDVLQVYVTWTDGQVWQVRSLGEIQEGFSEVYSSGDLDQDALATQLVLYFLFPEQLPETLVELPVRPDFLKTIPDWRANIQFRSKTTAAAYQGDYPDAMLRIPKGSMASIGPMSQGGDGVVTKFILTNARQHPQIEKGNLVLQHLKSRKVVGEFSLTSNNSNVIDLSDFEMPPEDPLCMFSGNMAGVPLYLSHDTDYRHMSLEHTHPPHALTVFGNMDARLKVVANMKKYWLQDI